MTGRRHVDVVVVGAGVVGASLARAAARAGMSVTVLDAGGGSTNRASDVPVALVNPWRGRKGDAHPDDLRASVTAHAWADQLEAEGHVAAFHRSGVTRIAVDPRQATAWRRRCGEHVGLTWLEPRDVPVPYEAPYGAMRVERGAWIDAPAWTASLLSSARAAGAQVVPDAVVDTIAPNANGVASPGERPPAWPSWQVHAQPTSRGAAKPFDAWTLDARAVVLCTGASPLGRITFGKKVAPLPRWTLTGGHLVALRSNTGDARPKESPPVAGSVYLVRRRGMTWVGGGHVDLAPPHRAGNGGVSWAPDHDAREGLRRAAARFDRSLAEADLGEGWSGVRARSLDGRPSWVELAPGLMVLGGFAGRGFLASALEAERAVDRLRSFLATSVSE